MNKGELIKAVVAKKPYRTRASEVEQIINTTLDEIKDSLGKGVKVNITGFGSFTIEARKGRDGRNPRTGAAVRIPACNVIKFKPGKGLKKSVN